MSDRIRNFIVALVNATYTTNFYKYGLEVFEPCLEAIKKAIMLEPNNLEYKKMLNELEQEKAMNDERDL